MKRDDACVGADRGPQYSLCLQLLHEDARGCAERQPASRKSRPCCSYDRCKSIMLGMGFWPFWQCTHVTRKYFCPATKLEPNIGACRNYMDINSVHTCGITDVAIILMYPIGDRGMRWI